RVQLDIPPALHEIVRVRFDNDRLPARADAVPEEQAHHAVVRAEVEHPRLSAISTHETDARSNLLKEGAVASMERPHQSSIEKRLACARHRDDVSTFLHNVGKNFKAIRLLDIIIL